MTGNQIFKTFSKLLKFKWQEITYTIHLPLVFAGFFLQMYLLLNIEYYTLI